MSKLWLVALNEYKRHTQKRSFLFGLLSVPLVIAVVIAVGLLLGRADGGSSSAIGYVDQAGLLVSSPPAPSSDAEEAVWLIPFPGEEEALRALEGGEILAYYVLPADYLRSNRVHLYHWQDIPDQAIVAFRDFLQINLLADQSPEVAYRAAAGSELTIRLPDGREFDGSFNLGYLLPLLAGLALVVLIFFGSGYLMQAVSDEKANRTMEILTTSLSPGQLIRGKILGIAAVSFSQLLLWGAAVVLAGIVGRTYLGLEWMQDIRVDPATLLIVVAMVVPAYLFVAALMTTIGATLVEPRGSQQVMAVFVSLYMLPLGFLGPLLNDLNDPTAVVLSFFPLTSPIFLPLRATLVYVPFWQIAASVAIQCLCALGALWLAGRAVRLGMLRYGRTLNWRALLGWAPRPAAVGAGRPAQRPRIQKLDQAVPPSATGRRARNKIWLVLRHDLTYIVTRPWFALMMLGLPLLVAGQMWLVKRSFSEQPAGPSTPTAVSTTVTMPSTTAPEVFGYVDHSGLVRSVPAQVPAGMVVAYLDEASARQALERGEISSYFIIPANYVETGDLIQVRPDFSPLMPNTSYRWMSWVLLANMLGGDLELASRVWNPMDLQAAAPVASQPDEAQAAADEEAEDEERLTVMLIMLLFYAVIIMAAGFLLRSVSDEKKNRTIEVLLLSASPNEILAGKMVALGLAGLLQAVGWGVIGYFLFVLGGMTFRLPGGMTISADLLAWSAVFFICGYAVYAALYAGAGALVPHWREATGVSLVLTLPAFIGFEITLFQQETPHSALMTGSSLFPLTAPFTMVKRLMSGGVPLWQLLLSVGLMIGAAYLITRAVARMFRAQYLLSGKPFSWKAYFDALLGRA